MKCSHIESGKCEFCKLTAYQNLNATWMTIQHWLGKFIHLYMCFFTSGKYTVFLGHPSSQTLIKSEPSISDITVKNHVWGVKCKMDLTQEPKHKMDLGPDFFKAWSTDGMGAHDTLPFTSDAKISTYGIYNPRNFVSEKECSYTERCTVQLLVKTYFIYWNN
jgi:hypothetical protein